MRLSGVLLFVPTATLALKADWPPTPPGLTAYQMELLRSADVISLKASIEAEAILLEEFGKVEYHLALLEKDPKLAALKPTELLQQLKANLDALEFTTNLGLSEEDRVKSPGKAGPNITTIYHWGFFPNMWQLKWNNSTLVAGNPPRQWDIYDGSEVGLYNLKGFAHPKEHNPTWEEAAERPSYAYMNMRRIDTGCDIYGAYAMIYRGSVVKERSLSIATDSGGWQVACNKTLQPGNPPWYWKIAYHFYDCTAMGAKNYTDPKYHALPGRPGSVVHTLLRNAQAFHRYTGHFSEAAALARIVWQIMNPSATVDPAEVLMNPEAIILGAVKTQDLKFMTADFAGLFGSEDGDKLVDFCKRHELPLAWSLGDARNEDQRSILRLAPVPFGFPKVTSGRARMLEPATANFTNGTAISTTAWAAWKKIDSQMRAFRATGKETSPAQVTNWWEQLQAAQTSVSPLRGGDCEDTDLCFGTEGISHQCICRLNPQATVTSIFI